MINMLGLVSAHTGNDIYNHGMKFFDFIIGIALIFALSLFILWVVKRNKNH